MALGVLLAGSVLASGGMVFAQDGPIRASDRRVQDEQDDLELSARGSGRLAEDQQALDSTMDGRILGPAAPAAGEAVRRDADGRVTLRAFRLAEPLTVDGVLDDPCTTRSRRGGSPAGTH